ncbi:hypothetical protein RKD37_003294 [Streptomyces ambofaciens]|uniref:DUF5708 family protein n=1 Tax=Streptomyces TaxID=1883 RepID=UPI0007503E55|nr:MULTISPECIES: DUF5708 family protein [Streptomyces]MBQ0884943.1 hypothetical protein [Streptomyces sp. RM72]OMI86796.1 hypothetical protein BSZ07_26580 [Streptomyces sp. M1013]
MTRASKNLLEGVVTLLAGLAVWLTTGGVEVPVVTLTKVGVVLMCVGGAQTAWGLYGAARRHV